MLNRRHFLQLLRTSPIALMANSTSLFAHDKPKQQLNWILIDSTTIAGFRYYQGHEILDHIHCNDSVYLNAETDNIYDAYAVEVYYHNKKLGYIPRTNNQHLSRMLQANVALKAKVTAVNPDQQPWQALEISIYLGKPS